LSRPIVIVRYGEIGLKGGNRSAFEKTLRDRVKDSLRAEEHGPIERPHGRILVRDPVDTHRIAERVARVFGVTSTSPGVTVPCDLDQIVRAGVQQVEQALTRRGGVDGTGLTFKADARRADKRFGSSSHEINLAVAEAVLDRFPALGVRMKSPDVTLGVEVRAKETLVHADRLEGPGGLPVGSLGRAVVLFSGGIDSPVAAWMAMKRGLHVELLHFHAAPFVGDASKEKAIDLARALSRWCGRLRLTVIPFADTQVAIKQGSAPPYRTILYRRSMNRIAAWHADAFNAGALVTGEALGQVASQTLENLACIEDTADRTVLRPLVAHDKSETIGLARRIGTYDVSIRPHPDCCTLFMPAHPKIHGNVDEVRSIDQSLELSEIEAEAWEKREVFETAEGNRV